MDIEKNDTGDSSSKSETELPPEVDEVFRRRARRVLKDSMRDAALEEGLDTTDSEINQILNEIKENDQQ